jgi:hypothetical protein
MLEFKSQPRHDRAFILAGAHSARVDGAATLPNAGLCFITCQIRALCRALTLPASFPAPISLGVVRSFLRYGNRPALSFAIG